MQKLVKIKWNFTKNALQNNGSLADVHKTLNLRNSLEYLIWNSTPDKLSYDTTQTLYDEYIDRWRKTVQKRPSWG